MSSNGCDGIEVRASPISDRRRMRWKVDMLRIRLLTWMCPRELIV